MGGKTSKPDITSSKAVATTTTPSSDAIQSRQRIIQNFLLIWMDPSIDQSDKGCQNSLAQLQNVVNDVHIFTQCDECIDFLTEVDHMKTFLIVEDTIGQQIVPLIHDIPQLDAVYIVCSKKNRHEQWTKAWAKVKGIHTEITGICDYIQDEVKQCNQDSIAVSFVAVGEEAFNQNLNQLDPLFMYTQIFKEILLKMEYNNQSIKNFITYCRNGNCGSPSNITLFEKEYEAKLAVWWYTFPSFIYSMLNCALRMMESDTIINMGFFIRDLHYQIEQIYQKQVSNYKGKSFVVYRGQGLSTTDFEKLCETKGGLMSFNNFLSTSKDREISLVFADCASTKNDTIGILFQISIDPAVSTVPFANIQGLGYYKDEEEILFSMHTVFRIGEIQQINGNSSLYQVDLKLTSDDDEQLRTLTEHIRKETPGETGWKRLGLLLMIIGHFDKAEKLYSVLLEQTSDEGEKTSYYNNLGCVKGDQGDYEKAICYYEKALGIIEKNLPSNHSLFAIFYNNLGEMYREMGQYRKAFSFYEKAIEIQQKTLPPDHPHLAASYSNIGVVYDKMGDYSTALSFYKKVLEIEQKTLPPNHPRLATSYNNIGGTHHIMGEYSKALSFFKKSVEIYKNTSSSNHPDLARSYNNIGLVYQKMREYSKALSFYKKALEIRQQTLPPNHPHLAISYNNIGLVCQSMKEYSKALSFYEKALEICQKTPPPNNHPLLAQIYNNIGGVYHTMQDYSKALSCYSKALEIRQKTLPPNHSDLAESYNNIGWLYGCMDDYSKALSYFERALNIYQSSLSANHPNIKSVQRSIEFVKAPSLLETIFLT